MGAGHSPKRKENSRMQMDLFSQHNEDGSLERYKALLVAKRYTQTYGVNFSETCVPIAKMNT